MKKYLVSAAFVLLVGGLVAGCDKEAKEEGKTVLPDPEVTAVSEIPGIPFYGTEFELKFTSSRNWMVTDATVDGSYDYDFKYSPIAGDAGKSTIKLTFPKNHTQEELEVTLTIALLDETSSTEGAYKHTFPTFTVPTPSVTDAAGNSYKVVLLKDDNYWMAENLRYVPEGKTVSDDPTKGDIWYPYDFSTLQANKDETLIKSNGLFYTLETAVGISLDLENAGKLEKVRGICPEGWHIPSFEEAYMLFGGATGLPDGCELDKPYDKAYYYYTEYKGGNVKVFNEVEPAVSLAFVGSVSINGTGVRSYTKGISGYENMPMTNFWTSTLYKTEKVTDKEELDKIKSQNFTVSLMATKSNPDGKITLGFCKMEAGSSVRCVMDKTDE